MVSVSSSPFKFFNIKKWGGYTKTNHKNIVSFAITVQIFTLLFAAVAVPAAAQDLPEFPLILGGTVEVDGEPAPVGTVITAGLNDEIVGCTQVDCEGVCGYCPENKLYITCAADDYGDLKFYVDGVESQLVDMDALINAKPGDILTSFIIASTGGSSSTTGGSASSSGSSSRSVGYSTTGDSDQDEAIGGVTSETSSKTTLKSTKTAQSSDSAEQVPASEKRSSMDSIGLVLVGGILLIVAIAGVRYTLKNS